jgi:hypothetical protein
MGKVVSMNSKKFLGRSSAQQSGGVFGDAPFFAGVLIAMVAPIVSYCSYRGPVSPMVFVAIALTGTIVGVLRHQLLPTNTLTMLALETAPQNPTSVDVKKAA